MKGRLRARAAVALLAAAAGCARVTIPAPGGSPDPSRILPLRLFPVAGPGRSMAVVLSGDGPFAGLANRLAADLRRAGIPTVMWHSTPYYWTPRTPEEAARDLDHVIRHFGGRWGRERVLVVGYSMGADIAPFLINRLPAATRGRVDAAVLVAMAHDAVFEFRVEQWWRDTSAPTRAVRPEVERLGALPLVCIHGRGDDKGACPTLAASGTRVVELRGGHHFRGDRARLSRVVVEVARGVERGR